MLEPEKHKITGTQKELIDKLLLERISLAGICRVVGASERWLQYDVNDKYAQTPRVIIFSGTSTGELVLQCNDLWPYVENSKKQWVWLTLDRPTREVVGVHMGKRDADAARSLWNSLPKEFQEKAISYTDFWAAYQ